MDSISIPISAFEKLAGTSGINDTTTTKDASQQQQDQNLSDSDSSCLGPILLYHPSPPQQSLSNHMYDDGGVYDNQKHSSGLFTILDNTVPLQPSSSENQSANMKEKDEEEIQVAHLHPILEEFMVLSANSIEDNYVKESINDDNEANFQQVLSSSSTSTSTSISISTPVPIWLKFIHAPFYCTDSFFDTDTVMNDERLLQPSISKKMFCIQAIQMNNIHDLTLSSNPLLEDDHNNQSPRHTANRSYYDIDMTLEYIYCTNDYYHQWFVKMGQQQWNHNNKKKRNEIVHDDDDDDNDDDNNNNNLDEIEESMFQYVHQVLCNALEFKVIKESMIIPLVLPQFPRASYNTIDHTNDNGDDENCSYSPYYWNDGKVNDPDGIITAFFKVSYIRVYHRCRQIIDNSIQFANSDINQETTSLSHEYYRIGAIHPCYHGYKNEDNIKHYSDYDGDNIMNTQVSIAISLPPQHAKHNDNGQSSVPNNHEITTTCPGYETLVDEIIALANIRIENASPKGILLTGCKGVGKSTLASVVIDRLKNDDTRATVNLISARDLLLQASSSTCDVNALKQIMISSIKKQDDISSSTQRINQRQIFVIDDLDVLLDEEDAGNNDSSSATSISKLSHERRIALQAVLEVIDEMVQPRRNNSMFDINSIAHDDNDVNLIPLILGVYCSESFNAPPILNRVGRFEKVLTMAPPSELQRQSIFISMLDQLPILKHGMKSGTNEDSRDKTKLIELWSTALARTTAGCVASDLKRICIDATTISGARSTKVNSNDDGDILLFSITEEEDKEIEVSWEDLKEATRSCIPSQLAQLDVTIPRDAMDQDNFDILSFVDTRGTKEWFQKCWPKFGGYHDMKADLYRTVFRPWCRRQHLSNKWDRRRMSQLEKEVPPPTGILFHGASGTGKTFAADCLARSLGLNIIKVRASDVLDKWLGGSEAAIRSIFARSRAAAPCLIMFDELDALATNRENGDDNNDGGGDLYSRLLSTLLNEMDGVNTKLSGDDSEEGIHGGNNNILVIGTTNRIHAIDAALLRPGRFEKHILLEKPSINDIHDILMLYLSKAPIHGDVNMNELVQLLHGMNMSGADIKGFCSETCLLAIRRYYDSKMDTSDNDVYLMNKDFEEAFNQL